MTKILKITALTLLMIGMVFTHPSSVFGQDRSKTPTLSIFPTKVKVSGAVSIQVRPSTTYFHPFFGLVVGSNPARGLEINADGHIIPEYQPGRYRDTIKGYSASPGKRIKVVIKTPKTHTITPYKIPQIKNPILAKTVVGAMARFITPTHNGILNPTGIPPKVTFSWTSGKAPYDIYIYEQKSPTQLGKRVFEKKGIFKTTITIAAATFVPDKKYRIFLIYKMGNFSFTGDFARGSSLQLRYSNAVSFSVKNRI